MGKRFFILLSLFIISAGWLSGFAQEVRIDSGAVTIYQDKLVDELIQKQLKLNEAGNNQDGYRIQIFFEASFCSNAAPCFTSNSTTGAFPSREAIINAVVSNLSRACISA